MIRLTDITVYNNLQIKWEHWCKYFHKEYDISTLGQLIDKLCYFEDTTKNSYDSELSYNYFLSLSIWYNEETGDIVNDSDVDEEEKGYVKYELCDFFVSSEHKDIYIAEN